MRGSWKGGLKRLTQTAQAVCDGYENVLDAAALELIESRELK